MLQDNSHNRALGDELNEAGPGARRRDLEPLPTTTTSSPTTSMASPSVTTMSWPSSRSAAPRRAPRTGQVRRARTSPPTSPQLQFEGRLRSMFKRPPRDAARSSSVSITRKYLQVFSDAVVAVRTAPWAHDEHEHADTPGEQRRTSRSQPDYPGATTETGAPQLMIDFAPGARWPRLTCAGAEDVATSSLVRSSTASIASGRVHLSFLSSRRQPRTAGPHVSHRLEGVARWSPSSTARGRVYDVRAPHPIPGAGNGRARSTSWRPRPRSVADRLIKPWLVSNRQIAEASGTRIGSSSTPRRRWPACSRINSSSIVFGRSMTGSAYDFFGGFVAAIGTLAVKSW